MLGGVTGEASLLRVQKRCLGQMGYCSGSGFHGNRCLLSFEFGVVVFLFALSRELENPGSVVLQPPTLWLSADVQVCLPAFAQEVRIYGSSYLCGRVEPGFVCMSESKIRSWLYSSLHW